MERCVVWIFTLYLLLTNYFIFTSASDIYCGNHNDQQGCTRKCQCANLQCPDNGDCSSNCSAGWMGKYCQYKNLAKGPPFNSLYDKTVDLLVYYPVSAVRISFNYQGNQSLFANVTVLVKNQTDYGARSRQICFSEEIRIEHGSKDLFCSVIWLGNEIVVEMSSYLYTITDIQVFGGRNVALWKFSNQSSNLFGPNEGNSARAVDGHGGHSFNLSICTHTNQESNPSWNVFLGQSFFVTWIQIVNRAEGLGYRLNGFKVASYDEKSKKELYEDNTHSSDGPGDTVYIDPNTSKLPAVLQNLTIYRTGLNPSSDNSVLVLCEVSLYACRPSQFGENCLSLCPENCNLNETCSNYECSSCKPGWVGFHCDTVAAMALFCTETQKRVCDRSLDCRSCQSLCHCRDGLECDPVSGHCSNGCDDGWIGEDCQYSNIPYNISRISVAQHGGQPTRELHNATINLNQDYPITALHIVTNGTRKASVPYIKAIVVSSRGVKSECESNLTAETNDIIVYCPYILKGKTIQVISNTSEIYKVDIFEGRNIALWGNADQSSTYRYDDASWPARFAVDGIATIDFDAMPRSCSHTHPGARQRAFLDLGFKEVVFITRIKLFLRSSHPERNQGIEVQLIGTDNEAVSVYNASMDSPVIELVHPAFIRKVMIHGGKPTQINVNILQICELQVFGCPYKGCDQLLKNCKKTIDNIDEDFRCKECLTGWEGPVCNKRKAVNCVSPLQTFIPHLKDGTGWTKKYKYGDYVNLTCEDGYQLFGHRNIFCNKVGEWSRVFPICKDSNASADDLAPSSVPVIAGGLASVLVAIFVIIIIVLVVKRRGMKHSSESPKKDDHIDSQKNQRLTDVQDTQNQTDAGYSCPDELDMIQQTCRAPVGVEYCNTILISRGNLHDREAVGQSSQYEKINEDLRNKTEGSPNPYEQLSPSRDRTDNEYNNDKDNGQAAATNTYEKLTRSHNIQNNVYSVLSHSKK